ncbi:hypothetical protein D3C71_1171860 [compost metagenome]
MSASASAVHTANCAMPLDCSAHTGKLSAYRANCSCRPFTTSVSMKNNTVPAPAAKLSIFFSVLAKASAGTILRSSSLARPQNFWLSAPNRITAREDCALKADGASRTACLIRWVVSFWLIGRFLPSTYWERRFLYREMAWLLMINPLGEGRSATPPIRLLAAILFACKIRTISQIPTNNFIFRTNRRIKRAGAVFRTTGRSGCRRGTCAWGGALESFLPLTRSGREAGSASPLALAAIAGISVSRPRPLLPRRIRTGAAPLNLNRL